MALKIAHQGVRIACSGAHRRQGSAPHPPQKISMAPCRASISLPFPKPHIGSCLVGRHAMPSANKGLAVEQRRQHENSADSADSVWGVLSSSAKISLQAGELPRAAARQAK